MSEGGSGGSSGGSSSGGGTPYMGIVMSVLNGVSGATGVYGAWYEGEQQRNYFMAQAELTYREKQTFLRQIEQKEKQTAMVRQDAADAYREVEIVKRVGAIKEKKFQEQTDMAVSSLLARSAASGVDTSFGSPLEYMSNAIDARSEELDMMSWGNKYDAYKQERQAASISDKATIMLDETQLMRSDLPMYDYQAQVFMQAGGEARRAARYKGYGIAIKAIGDSLSSF